MPLTTGTAICRRFTNYLSKVSQAWSSQVGSGNSVNWSTRIGGPGNQGVAGQVSQTGGSIGYVELAYIKQNNLAWATLQNAAGNWVEPSLKGTVAAASGVPLPADMKIVITNSSNPEVYPIAGLTWILAYREQDDLAKAQALANMLWWATHEGQAYTTELDYAPLSPGAQGHAEAMVRSMTYQGQPLLDSVQPQLTP